MDLNRASCYVLAATSLTGQRCRSLQRRAVGVIFVVVVIVVVARAKLAHMMMT